jgi:hypothetical protein
MPSSGMWRCVGLVRTDVSEESVTSQQNANIFPHLRTVSTQMVEATRSSETSGLTLPTRRPIPEDSILNSHRRGNLSAYNIALLSLAVFIRHKIEIVPHLPTLSTQIMMAIRFSETSGLTRPARRHILEDGIPHSHRRGNFRAPK